LFLSILFSVFWTLCSIYSTLVSWFIIGVS
jgi:hypothetical protein